LYLSRSPTPTATLVLFPSNVVALAGLSRLSLHDALPICQVFPVLEHGGHRFGPGPLVVAGPLVDAVGVRVLAPEHLEQPLGAVRSEEHTSELQSREKLVCRRLLEKKNVYVAITVLRKALI